MNIVYDIIKKVRQDEFFVPRDYKTIGGSWTVDTWKCKDIMVQVMDEGYTTVISAPGLKIVNGYNGTEYIRYVEGTEADAIRTFKDIE